MVIDPRRAFGAPTVDGVRTEVLYEMFVAGDPLDDIGADYDLDREAVEAAASGNQTRWGMLQLLVRHWDRIEDTANLPRPRIYGVNTNGVRRLTP